MNKAKRKRLEKAGWTVNATQDFLELSPEESTYIKIRLSLADALISQRKKLHYTQADLAKKIKSSQSRVAKMEVGDDSVSIDLQVRTLLRMGISRHDLGRAVAAPIKKRTS
ncbi:MAG: helix-turn-helix domain-containing protein [Cytophagaceae bacterium]|nr:MAG: helix-turn-helix domain-containing protein [Cytophagaceae bacterium]